MKSSEIHIGYPEKELRDYFAKTMSEIFDKECANKKAEIPYERDHALEWSIKDIDAEIAMLLKKKEIIYQKIAVRSLIVERGWDEWDVSDYTINDCGFKLKLNFIGTRAESDELMVKLEEERENS